MLIAVYQYAEEVNTRVCLIHQQLSTTAESSLVQGCVSPGVGITGAYDLILTASKVL